MGCGGSGPGRGLGDESSTEGAVTLIPDSAIISAQEELTATVMALPGVTGTAVGLCGDTVCIKVFLARADSALMDQIPEVFRGFKVDAVVSDEFRPRGIGG